MYLSIISQLPFADLAPVVITYDVTLPSRPTRHHPIVRQNYFHLLTIMLSYCVTLASAGRPRLLSTCGVYKLHHPSHRSCYPGTFVVGALRHYEKCERVSISDYANWPSLPSATKMSTTCCYDALRYE